MELEVRRSAALCALSASLVLLALIQPAAAHAQQSEEPVEILQAAQGMYRLSVYVLPRVPTVGQINFMVYPVSAADGQPVPDAEVTLVAHDDDGTPTYQVRALNTPSSEQEYVGNLTIRAPGFWDIHVRVSSEGLGEEIFIARLSVAPASVGSNPAGGYVMVFVLACLVAGGVFVWIRSRSALSRRNDARTTA